MSKKRDTFIFKKSWADALKKRSAAVQLEVYNAIVSYAVDGVIPEMSEIAEVVFDFIRIEIDENNAKYEEVVKKRREAGKRGMEIRYSKNEDVNPVELPVLEGDSNNSNKKQQKVTKLTKGNKTNKCYQKVTNVTDSINDSDSDIQIMANSIESSLYFATGIDFNGTIDDKVKDLAKEYVLLKLYLDY